jgi:cytochrome c peroxidase
MHDGSVATLDEVLELYRAGGRAETPYLDFRMKTFELDDEQRADFMAFFESLTDDAVLTDPALADPW